MAEVNIQARILANLATSASATASPPSRLARADSRTFASHLPVRRSRSLAQWDRCWKRAHHQRLQTSRPHVAVDVEREEREKDVDVDMGRGEWQKAR